MRNQGIAGVIRVNPPGTINVTVEIFPSGTVESDGPEEFLVWLKATDHIKRIHGTRQRLALQPHNHTVETFSCQH